MYGDPRPWSGQGRPLMTVLSFLNTTKYPPSLSFLLMTLGPSMLFLAWADRLRLGERNPLVVFGRVPLFYFVLHIPIVHAFAIVLTWLRYGAAPFLFLPPPTLGTPRDDVPAGLRLGSVGCVRRHGSGGRRAVSHLPVLRALEGDAQELVVELLLTC